MQHGCETQKIFWHCERNVRKMDYKKEYEKTKIKLEIIEAIAVTVFYVGLLVIGIIMM